MHYVHNDIKLENILVEVTENGQPLLKLSDFGFATPVEFNHGTIGYCVGTPEYMAPEVFSKRKKVSEKADIWSATVLACLILTKRHPFKQGDVVNKHAIMTGDPDLTGLEQFSSGV